ncbi:vegetative cell wall protein gp1-like isoform X2 [Amphibalanus amphitrite]|uniref:vegetative cell wall protein gp1-like isoform X2 n=1 Tax=Amphibalanus amphitrite TaxID=1232801 RepID=UPI001C91E5D0|nr:vegetative cell wall protein gp1-like isoform X2 [Amphibalanus amphitrite]
MAGGAQQFCLKWNNYHVNIASSFDSLRVDEDFVDVTLACSGCQLKAHRMVLSACSPFFRQLLKSNPHPHPIVILRDVSQYNMELLLDFMYHGQVNVAQEQLPEFLKVAELLKVKGLADEKREEAVRAGPNGQPSGVRTPSSSPAPPPSQPTAPAPDESPPPPAKRHRPLPLPGLLHHPPPPAAAAPAPAPAAPPPPPPGAGYVEQAPVKREPVDTELGEYGAQEAHGTPPRSGGGGDERLRALHPTGLSPEAGRVEVPAEVAMEEAEQPLPPEASRAQPVGPGPSTGPHEASTDPLSRMLICPYCPHLSSNYGKLKAHIGKVHFPVPVTCADCGKVCKNKYALQVHKSKYHRRSWRLAGPPGIYGPPPAGSPVSLWPEPPLDGPQLARPPPPPPPPPTHGDGAKMLVGVTTSEPRGGFMSSRPPPPAAVALDEEDSG